MAPCSVCGKPGDYIICIACGATICKECAEANDQCCPACGNFLR